MALFKPRKTRLAKALRNNATEAERHLWRRLSNRQLAGLKFCRQIPVGRYVVDFLCRERGLVVEVDGGQHNAPSASEAERTAALEASGLKVIRFWNNEVLGNIEGVLVAIQGSLAERPTPDPSRKREGRKSCPSLEREGK